MSEIDRNTVQRVHPICHCQADSIVDDQFQGRPYRFCIKMSMHEFGRLAKAGFLPSILRSGHVLAGVYDAGRFLSGRTAKTDVALERVQRGLTEWAALPLEIQVRHWSIQKARLRVSQTSRIINPFQYSRTHRDISS